MPKIGKKDREPKAIKGATGYCRRCEETMPLSKFYEATNPLLDTNGFLSICRVCCNELYEHHFSIYGNLEDAIKMVCQDLDVRFSQEALKQTKSQVDKIIARGDSTNKVFGYYKSKLSSTGKANEGLDSFRYRDSDFTTREDANAYNANAIDVDNEDLKLFWGKGFSYDDYVFLETELSNWKQTHKCDNYAELTLLKEICTKILEVRKKRELRNDTGKLQKDLQDLMKTASVDPAKSNIASSGKSHDAWGVWIKDIEQFEPAEWHEQQEKYKDMDGFDSYIKDYIVRPIKNFITNNRDFNIEDDYHE